jgi:type 1 glutamine amidotransferase
MPHALPENGKIRTAVVTGGHSFQVPPFLELFRSMPAVDAYPQSLDEFTADRRLAFAYDVVLFYTMHRFRPGDELPWYQKEIFRTLEELGAATQGICVLHHALVAFPEWPLWSELVGITNRTGITPHFNQTLTVEVADPAHPITQGIPARWILHDETYGMADADPQQGNHLVLTTAHEPSMRTLAWTRTFRDSRVFCYQSGHDDHAFDDTNFRRVMSNALHWLARRAPFDRGSG